MIQIGRGLRDRPTGLVDLLLDCHGRIRSMLALARKIVDTPTAEPGDVAEAADRIRRYFDEALPLHVADEEATIEPRLRGLDPRVDDGLRRMHRQHEAHEGLLAALIETTRLLADAPRDADAIARLEAVSASLTTELHEHLAQEELVVFPALASLIEARPELEAEMIAELRDRREPVAS